MDNTRLEGDKWETVQTRAGQMIKDQAAEL